MTLRSFYFFLITISVMANNSYSQAFQDLDAISAAVKVHILTHAKKTNPNTTAEAQVTPLDPRLKLATCDKDLTLKNKSYKQNASNMTVHVSCTGTIPWGLYVNAQVQQWGPVAVASRDLGKGEIITKADIMLAPRDINRLNSGFIQHPKEAIGNQVKRPVRQGSEIRINSLAPPLLVDKGDHVTVTATNGSISVKTSGIALSRGTLNDQIKVQNNKSEKVFKARVTGKGQVMVNL